MLEMSTILTVDYYVVRIVVIREAKILLCNPVIPITAVETTDVSS